MGHRGAHGAKNDNRYSGDRCGQGAARKAVEYVRQACFLRCQWPARGGCFRRRMDRGGGQSGSGWSVRRQPGCRSTGEPAAPPRTVDSDLDAGPGKESARSWIVTLGCTLGGRSANPPQGTRPSALGARAAPFADTRALRDSQASTKPAPLDCLLSELGSFRLFLIEERVAETRLADADLACLARAAVEVESHSGSAITERSARSQTQSGNTARLAERNFGQM